MRAPSVVRLLVASLAVVLLAAPAAAKEYPLQGGPGGGPFSLRCPAGAFVVGIYGRAGEWIDGVGLICAPYDANSNTVGAAFQAQPYRGGNGGGGGSVQCAPGQIVGDIGLYFQSDRGKASNPTQYVRGIALSCTLPRGSPVDGRCFGVCRHGDLAKGLFARNPGDKTRAWVQQYWPQERMVGLNIRYGTFLDAAANACAPLPDPVVAAAPPPPPAPPKPIKTTGKAKTGGNAGSGGPPGLLVCRTGGAMKPFGTPSNDGAMLVSFEAAPQGADVALPGPGQCAWDVQAVSPNAPKRLGLTSKVMAVLGDIQSDKVFKVHARVMSAFLFTTGDVEIVSGNGPVMAGAGEPAAGGEVGEPAQGGGGDDGGGMAGGGMGGGGMGGGGMAMPSGDCPAGTATVQTPAGLDFLNVREGPSAGASVVAQVPNGSEVSVSGGCFKAAAGLTQQKVKIPVGGWCRIEAPDQGCVKAEFLVFGGDAGGGAPIDPAKGAGFAMQKPKGQGLGQGQGGGNGFGGHWSANADGVTYDLRLTQVGSVVKGSFTASDGSRGTILGNLNGKTLRFAWVQTNDGQTGSGKFVLSGSGGSFSGTYNFQVGNFDKVEGQWNGQRM